MEERIKRKVWPQRGWVYLRDLGMTLQRPRHVKADPLAQEAFKKDSPSLARCVCRQHPGTRVELWAEDEARLG